MESKGITSERIAEKIEVLLEASTPIYKNNNETGEIEHVGDRPDFNAIDKGITHAIKIGIGGGYAPEKHVVANIVFNNDQREAGKKAIKTVMGTDT